MSTEVDRTAASRLADALPSAVFGAATDYVLAGRLADLVRLGTRLKGRVKGHNGSYSVTADLAGTAQFTCDCGRDQPCRHAASLVVAWNRDPAAFTDLEPLLDSWRGEAAEAALRHVVERCFGPVACDSTAALLELRARATDADPLRLETLLEAVTALAVVDRERVPARVAEIRARAADLAQRQGRTAAVRALAELTAAGARLLARPGWVAWQALRDELNAVVRDLDALLARGGLAADALSGSLSALAEALPLMPASLLLPVLNAGGRISGRAPEYLTYRLRAAIEAAKAGLALPDGVTTRERVRELVVSLVEFQLACGRDDEALALARAEARGPAGALPLVEALAGSGRTAEAIAAARDALAGAGAVEVAGVRRRLADLLRQSGRPDMALAYLAANYGEHPDAAGFAELRELATGCGQWSELRSGALTRLRERGGPGAYAEAVIDEARAIEQNAPDEARDLLAGALLGMPTAAAGGDDDLRRGIDLLLRAARRQYRRLSDETGWRALREECRRRHGSR